MSSFAESFADEYEDMVIARLSRERDDALAENARLNEENKQLKQTLKYYLEEQEA